MVHSVLKVEWPRARSEETSRIRALQLFAFIAVGWIHALVSQDAASRDERCNFSGYGGSLQIEDLIV